MMLEKQYRSVRSSRHEVLQFLSTIAPADLVRPVASFNHKSIRDLVVHIHDIYIHWAANYALQLQFPYASESSVTTAGELVSLCAETDKLMDRFFQQFGANPDQEITNHISGSKITISALTVFTHLITHEFHHKGQIMSMTRLLGYVPPDTDVIRF